MSILHPTPELKSLLLFSAAGIAMGGISALAGRALFAGIIGIALLYALRKFAAKLFGIDSAALMQSGIMPYLTFWYAAWVVLVNV